MRKYVILFLALFTVSFAKAQTPLEFNDKLVSITDSLYRYGQAWGKKFNEVVASKEYSQLSVESQVLGKFLARNLVMLTSMKDIAGSENLRKSMIDFLKYEKTMMQRAFLPFEKLTKASSKEELEAAYENLKVQTANEAEALQKVNKEQELYAVKNGFTIEKE